MASASLAAEAQMPDARGPHLTAYRLLGFALIAVLPALVWPLIIMLGFWLFGQSVSVLTLVVIGAAILAFLTCIAAGLMSSNDAETASASDASTVARTPSDPAGKRDDQRAA